MNMDILKMAGPTDNSKVDPFRLERAFSDPASLFLPVAPRSVAEKDTLVVVDTNTLLLPYTVKKNELSDLADVYRTLAKEKRLFLPARAAREFIVHRDRKLSDIITEMQNVKSKLNVGESYTSPLFDTLAANQAIKDVHKQLLSAKKDYSDAIAKAVEEILSWRGDDPITNIYREIFKSDSIIDTALDNKDLIADWEYRSINKIPPGYKDSNKEDGGIGDYLIWKSIVALGEKEQKDLVFVTGDEKTDWFIRANNQPVYPRPELCSEYRQASKGRIFRLASLHEILKEMNAPKATVAEFEKAEDSGFIKALSRFSAAEPSAYKNHFYGGDIEANWARTMRRRRSINRFGMTSENVVIGPDGRSITFTDGGAGIRLHLSPSAEGGSLWVSPSDDVVLGFVLNGSREQRFMDGEFITVTGPIPVSVGETFFASCKQMDSMIFHIRSVSTNNGDMMIGLYYCAIDGQQNLF